MSFVDPSAAADFIDNLPGGDEPATASTETPAAAVADTPAVASTETPAAAVAPVAGGEPDTFDRAYVEELRRESANYRTRAKPFMDAFDGYDDEARDVMLGLARNLVSAPEAAARDMIEVSKAILGDKFDAMLSGEPQPLTREDLEREFQAREEARQQQELVAQVEREVADLGYAADSDEAAMLYGIAARRGGDIKGAHQFLQDLRQVAVDEFLADKQRQGAAYPTVVTEGGPATSDAGPPKTLEEASARFRAMQF